MFALVLLFPLDPDGTEARVAGEVIHVLNPGEVKAFKRAGEWCVGSFRYRGSPGAPDGFSAGVTQERFAGLMYRPQGFGETTGAARANDPVGSGGSASAPTVALDDEEAASSGDEYLDEELSDESDPLHVG